MKRKILALAAIVGVFAAIGAIGAPSALAGNCTPTYNNALHPGYIWYTPGIGTWTFHPLLAACSNVTGMDFSTPGSGPNDGRIYDRTRGVTHEAQFGGGTCLSGGFIPSCESSFDTYVWGSGCGAPPFSVQAQYSYRIRSRNNGIDTWGPFHANPGAVIAIC